MGARTGWVATLPRRGSEAAVRPASGQVVSFKFDETTIGPIAHGQPRQAANDALSGRPSNLSIRGMAEGMAGSNRLLNEWEGRCLGEPSSHRS
jgi:hypothetical protein